MGRQGMLARCRGHPDDTPVMMGPHDYWRARASIVGVVRRKTRTRPFLLLTARPDSVRNRLAKQLGQKGQHHQLHRAPGAKRICGRHNMQAAGDLQVCGQTWGEGGEGLCEAKSLLNRVAPRANERQNEAVPGRCTKQVQLGEGREERGGVRAVQYKRNATKTGNDRMRGSCDAGEVAGLGWEARCCARHVGVEVGRSCCCDMVASTQFASWPMSRVSGFGSAG